METILTMGGKDHSIDYIEKRAVRAVVFDGIGRVALLHVTKKGHHGLPGGGIESGETNKKALKREIMEEVGAVVQIIEELGTTIEYRDFVDIPEIKYNDYYICVESGSRKSPAYTQKEIEWGFKVKWVEIEKAIEILENDERRDKKIEFIVERDLYILNQAKKIIED